MAKTETIFFFCFFFFFFSPLPQSAGHSIPCSRYRRRYTAIAAKPVGEERLSTRTPCQPECRSHDRTLSDALGAFV